MALYHSARGSVNYTIVGSPTIVDGVASGFSSSNYLKTDTVFPNDYTSNSYEFQVKIQTPSTMQASNIMGAFFRYAASDGFSYTAGGRLQWFFGGGTNILQTETNYIQPNSVYVIRGVYQSDTLSLYVGNSVDNLQLVASQEINDFTIETAQAAVLGVALNKASPFNGSIDLNHTYIKVNGQPWFGMCPIEVKKHQVMGPVGYTVVGSPTITDGVASGFSANNYLKTSSPLSVADNTPFEFYMTFTCVSENIGITAFTGSYDSLSFGYYGSVKKPVLRIRQANNTAYKQFVVNYTMSINNTYSIKAVYNGTNLVCYLYDSSLSLLQTETFNGENLNISSSYAFRIGGRQDGSHFSGSIDLNHTYIKVNGKIWFWQPQETKRIVVNGVEVWTKPE